jgi:hypothetical protein
MTKTLLLQVTDEGEIWTAEQMWQRLKSFDTIEDFAAMFPAGMAFMAKAGFEEQVHRVLAGDEPNPATGEDLLAEACARDMNLDIKRREN